MKISGKEIRLSAIICLIAYYGFAYWLPSSYSRLFFLQLKTIRVHNNLVNVCGEGSLLLSSIISDNNLRSSLSKISIRSVDLFML